MTPPPLFRDRNEPVGLLATVTPLREARGDRVALLHEEINEAVRHLDDPIAAYAIVICSDTAVIKAAQRFPDGRYFELLGGVTSLASMIQARMEQR